MKRLLAWALAFLFVAPLLFSSEVRNATHAYKYDVDSASLTYTRLVGQGGDPFGGPMNGPGTIKTTGSSTTVDENVVGSNPFTDVAVGDILIVNRSTTQTDVAVVVAKASAAQITVDAAVNWSAGYAWRWYDFQSGTTVTDGWIDVSGNPVVALTLQYDQGDLDGLRARWECRTAALGAQPVIVYPGETSDCGIGGTLSTDRCNFATAGTTARLSVLVEDNPFASCRVGLAYAAADASDAGVALEQVTVTVTKAK